MVWKGTSLSLVKMVVVVVVVYRVLALKLVGDGVRNLAIVSNIFLGLVRVPMLTLRCTLIICTLPKNIWWFRYLEL